MSAIARHDARTLFERAWAHARREGTIDAARREALLAEGTRGMRRIATVIGTDHLREDLERAMRAMLGLVNLHLHRVSDGDVAAAARSLADNGLLFHTKGASTAIKQVLAVELGEELESLDDATRRGLDEQVVAVWSGMSWADFAARERGAEERRRRRGAARALASALDGRPPEPYHEPEQVILTALLILAYTPKRRAWIADLRGFESLLESVRATPSAFASLPAGVPLAYRPIVETVWRERAPRALRVITDASVPLHRLVGGDPLTNPLHDWLVVPDSALDEVDSVGAHTTAHWETLTGGRTDEEHLLLVMLAGIYGIDVETPLSLKAAEALVKTTCAERPDDRLVEAWLDANAPHQYHDGLVGLWTDFFDDREVQLEEGTSALAWRVFAAQWLPVRAPKAS